MAVSGLPEPCASHARGIARLALDMMDRVKEVQVDGEPVVMHHQNIVSLKITLNINLLRSISSILHNLILFISKSNFSTKTYLMEDSIQNPMSATESIHIRLVSSRLLSQFTFIARNRYYSYRSIDSSGESLSIPLTR